MAGEMDTRQGLETLTPQERYADVANTELKKFLIGFEAAPILTQKFPVPLRGVVYESGGYISDQASEVTSNKGVSPYSDSFLKNFSHWIAVEQPVTTVQVRNRTYKAHGLKKEQTRVMGALLWDVQFRLKGVTSIRNAEGKILVDDVREKLGPNYLSRFINDGVNAQEPIPEPETEEQKVVFRRSELGEWQTAQIGEIIACMADYRLHGVPRGLIPKSVLDLALCFAPETDDKPPSTRVVEGLKAIQSYCNYFGVTNLEELVTKVREHQKSRR